MSCQHCRLVRGSVQCGNNCKTLYCGQKCADKHWETHREKCIGLYVDLPNEIRLDFEETSKTRRMWMHGTRSTVFSYMSHMAQFDLKPGIYSSGLLYQYHIYPMTGALGGDLISERENVGKKVVSGLVNSSGNLLNRNVYYSLYGKKPITFDRLVAELEEEIQRVIRNGYSTYNKTFGQISRVRYWNNLYYLANFQRRIQETIVPLIRKQMESLKNGRPLINDAIAKVIDSNEPVFQFTEQEKNELGVTYPIVFLSEKAGNEAWPKGKDIFSAEPDEMYVSELLMKDVDIIYTTSQGCNYVAKKMAEFGNTKVKIICNDKLWKSSDTLTGYSNRFRPPKEERRKQKEELQRRQEARDAWLKVIPSLGKYDPSTENLLNSQMLPIDFEGSSLEEITPILNEFGLTQKQIEELYANLQ